ncbi:SIR2 family protein [Bradyrhizobium betae]
MKHILLTGAGFSRNWGGWLADEAFEYLLGCAEVTPNIRHQLWMSKGRYLGFEDTLREIREQSEANPDIGHKKELQAFEKMLEGMFHTMAIGFSSGEFEPGQDPHRIGPQPHPIRDFLCRFDAIFTLNQDTLLEQRYAQSNLLEGSQGRWFGLQSPGVADILVNGQKYAAPGLFKPTAAPFRVQDRQQPYYKLHGSSNWRSADDSALLILGGDKGNDIAKVQLLSWYQIEFARLTQHGARVMVIGYGFGDAHINDLFIAAAAAGAEFFIIDTSGIGVLASATGTRGIPSQLKMAMQRSIIGASRRYLKDSLFSDTVERTKIMKFFS